MVEQIIQRISSTPESHIWNLKGIHKHTKKIRSSDNFKLKTSKGTLQWVYSPGWIVEVHTELLTPILAYILFEIYVILKSVYAIFVIYDKWHRTKTPYAIMGVKCFYRTFTIQPPAPKLSKFSFKGLQSKKLQMHNKLRKIWGRHSLVKFEAGRKFSTDRHTDHPTDKSDQILARP